VSILVILFKDIEPLTPSKEAKIKAIEPSI
jgi:hypothetical protein